MVAAVIAARVPPWANTRVEYFEVRRRQQFTAPDGKTFSVVVVRGDERPYRDYKTSWAWFLGIDLPIGYLQFLRDPNHPGWKVNSYEGPLSLATNDQIPLSSDQFATRHEANVGALKRATTLVEQNGGNTIAPQRTTRIRPIFSEFAWVGIGFFYGALPAVIVGTRMWSRELVSPIVGLVAAVCGVLISLGGSSLVQVLWKWWQRRAARVRYRGLFENSGSASGQTVIGCGDVAKNTHVARQEGDREQ